MAYSNNPNLPRVRMQAVLLVRGGWSIRKAARHLGFSHGAVIGWLKKAPDDGRRTIPTESSRPKRHPRALSMELVESIVRQRKKRKRCGKVVHEELRRQGVFVSLSSVNRTLGRCGLLRKRSPWKRWHFSFHRPTVQNIGDLVQIDTIHLMDGKGRRFYVYTLIDLHSRFAYAKVVAKINTQASLAFVREAQREAGFIFNVIQSDNGPEFSSWFTTMVQSMGMVHRHTRVRRSNDNAHIERFNRTVQEECFDLVKKLPQSCKKALRDYLPYYNNERPHLGIEMQAPAQVVRRC